MDNQGDEMDFNSDILDNEGCIWQDGKTASQERVNL
jgi:hypothetical protein